MSLLLLILAALSPRLLLACIWLFSDNVQDIFQGWFVPLLGLLFMPYTTLTYLAAMVYNHSTADPWRVLILIAMAADAAHAYWGRRYHLGRLQQARIQEPPLSENA